MPTYLQQDFPAVKAWQWIQTEAGGLTSTTSFFSIEELIERLALATFYLATNGPSSWTSHDVSSWLSNQSVCTWYNQAAQRYVQETTSPCTIISSKARQVVVGTGNVTVHNDSSNIFGTTLILPPQLVLTYPVLNDAGLSGTLPDELGLLTNLETLSLVQNQRLIGSTIPTTLGRLTKLRRIVLEGHNLIGTLPTELGCLTRLENLRFQRNAIGGTLPGGGMDELDEPTRY